MRRLQHPDDPAWEGTEVLGADWRERVSALKDDDGGDVVTTGSLSLCPALLEAGLVDELRLFTYPVVQGRGRRLFPEGWERSLRRVETRSFERGVVMTTYAVG